jgi:hypothetical protein
MKRSFDFPELEQRLNQESDISQNGIGTVRRTQGMTPNNALSHPASIRQLSTSIGDAASYMKLAIL